ncbi:MAG: hypothetical protein JXR91_10870 [Deltaproteobacteria bacterium]|nr:hypothetical protein [Deltaproteobacteria bacterium]
MAGKSTVKNKKNLESDLYQGVKTFLETLGYEVKGEILDFDVTAIGKDDTLLAVELKLTLNIKLIIQAIERLSIVDFVYLGIPDTDTFYKKNRRSVTKLLQYLGLGLLLVNVNKNSACPAIYPTEYKPRKLKKKRTQLIKEFNELSGDPNLGGSSTRHKKMTVYRQKALQIAAHLIEKGCDKASNVRDATGLENARDILYQNHYKWFDPLGKGIYKINKLGVQEFSNWKKLLK